MSFRGNPLLKRVNTPRTWTPEEVKEWSKCKKDPVHFIEKYMKIINIDRGLISFKLFDYQREMVLDMKNNRKCAFCWARQSGKSIAVCGFFLWYMIFHKHKESAILANKGDTAIEILGRIQLAYQHLPDWMSHGVIEWNKGSFVLENGSSIIASATSSDNVRGLSLNIVYIDECAFIDNWPKFSASLLPTISSGKTSKIIMTSTPNGLNHFHKIIKLGDLPKTNPDWNGYKTLKVKWDQVPDRDEEWRAKTLADMNFDMAQFDQEYNIEFLGSSGSLIAGWKLKELTPAVAIEEKEFLFQYEKPVKGHIYMIVADVSHGKGLDHSAFSIVDVTTTPYRQVCSYKHNYITPIDFAAFIYQMAITYNNSYVLLEVNDMGEVVGNSLLYDFEYENMLMSESMGVRGKVLTAGFGSSKCDKGLRTTVLSKSQGCSILKLLIEGNKLEIVDIATIEELSRFSRKGKSYEAEEGWHDDLVMGLVTFAWASNQELFKELTNINTLVKLREIDELQMEQDMSPFGFIDDGQPEEDIINEPVEINWLWR